jgi:hypothetical protein
VPQLDRDPDCGAKASLLPGDAAGCHMNVTIWLLRSAFDAFLIDAENQPHYPEQ